MKTKKSKKKTETKRAPQKRITLIAKRVDVPILPLLDFLSSLISGMAGVVKAVNDMKAP